MSQKIAWESRLVKVLFGSLLTFFILNAWFIMDCPASDADRQAKFAGAVNDILQPLMKEHGIPGMAVAVTIDGDRLFANFGVRSKDTAEPVTETTLFEIGSVSKTFTAVLAAYAQVLGRLDLNASVSASLPALKGSAFDRVRVIDFAVHTSGGLPLQVPATVGNEARLLDYLTSWKPAYAAGTRRNYSNVSIGLLGRATAESLGMEFEQAVAAHLLVPLGLTRTFYGVPENSVKDCAQGYDANGRPVRMRPGLLSSESYGMRSCAEDLLRWLEANMGSGVPDAQLRQAMNLARGGYVSFGDVIQGMVWEQYRLPVTLEQLRAGNSYETLLGKARAKPHTPPLPPHDAALINKTGSTNGFGAYILFIPSQKTGLVLLANKNYPNEARVMAAWRILAVLEELR